MENLVLVSAKDLAAAMRSTVLDKYADIDVCSATVCDILKISKPTLDRWVKCNIIRTCNDPNAPKRENRDFNLAYILGLNKRKLKGEYREVSA